MPHSEDSEEQPHVDQPNDPLLEKIKNYILTTYEPVQNPADADVRMSTLEIWDAVYKLYPNKALTADMLANWLHEKGFTFFDAGKMRFEWLLKTVH